MKNIILFFLLFSLALAVGAEGIREDQARDAEKADYSYAFGQILGGDLKDSGVEFNYPAFTEGFKAAVEGGDTRFSEDEAMDIAQEALDAGRMKIAERNRARETAFLAENGRRAGVVTTASGLQYEVLVQGEGPKPERADTVSVNYEGSLIDGTVFDSSYQRGEPFEFRLDQVIRGWAEGLSLMNVGSAYRLYIPSDLAYGEGGAGAVIQPNSTLIFKVELLEILRSEE